MTENGEKREFSDEIPPVRGKYKYIPPTLGKGVVRGTPEANLNRAARRKLQREQARVMKRAVKQS